MVMMLVMVILCLAIKLRLELGNDQRDFISGKEW